MNLRLPPLAWVAIAAGASAVIRFVVALQVRAPVFYPDEYLSTDFARNIANGSFGSIRGGSYAHTYTSYFAPVVQSPFWLLEDVNISVRLSQALGAIAFSAAAFPAYALSRRLGVSAKGSLTVALLALVIPAGAFTATLLAEPYAYPLFLVAVLIAVDAIARPTVVRHLVALGGAAGICFVGGLQFLYFLPAYAISWFGLAWPSASALLRRLALLAGISAAGLALLLMSGQSRYIEVLVGSVRYQSYPLVTVGSWLMVNAFVLAVAAGWVLVPGAVLGLSGLGRTTDPRSRAFALLTVSLIAGMLVEAALWGANDNGVYERFTFYGAPLLALAFVWGAEKTAPHRGVYAAVAYVGALAAVILPVTEPLFAAIDQHSPAINGLSEFTFGAEIGGGIWAPALALLAVGVAWRGIRSRRAILILTACVCIFAGAGQSFYFARVTEDRKFPPYVETPPDSAILTWPNTDPFLLLDVLFWNPEITRVVLVGRGVTPDGLPSIPARFVPPGKLVAEDGMPVRGPFVIGPDVTAVADGSPQHDLARFTTLSDVPPLLAFGFRRQTGDMGSSARFFAAAGDRPRKVVVRLRSPNRAKTMGLLCLSVEDRRFRIGAMVTSIVVPVPAHSTRFCHVYLIRGGIDRVGKRQVSVRASIALEP